MSPPEDAHLEKAFNEFRDKLHSSIPLRIFSEFHEETVVRKEAQNHRKIVLARFMNKIAAHPTETICDLVKELGSRIDALIEEWLGKNREHRKKSEDFMENRMKVLCSDMKTFLDAELLHNPNITLESFKESVCSRISLALMYFEDQWKSQPCHGKFLQEQKKIVEEKLEKVGKEMQEKQERHLEERSANEAEKQIEDIKMIVLGMSWQLRSFTESFEDVIAKHILKEKADELKKYLLGKGGVMNERYPMRYLQLLEALNDSFKLMEEADENWTRNEATGWAEGLDLKLKEYFTSEMISDLAIAATSSDDVMRSVSLTEMESTHHEQQLEALGICDTEVVIGVKRDNQSNLEETDNLLKRPRLAETLETGKAVTNLHVECNFENQENVNKEAEGNEGNEDQCESSNVSLLENDESDKDDSNEGDNFTKRYKDTNKDQIGDEELEKNLMQPGYLSNTAVKDADHPLIFRLSSNSLSVGTFDGEVFQILTNWKGEMLTVPIVGIDDGHDLTCGPDALSCQRIWSLSKFFQGVKTEITLRQANVLHHVCDEFLFAFLLRSIKEHAESYLMQSFTSAVIIIPSWLSIMHRFQVKDAAKIAGFDQSILVNEEAVAVHAMLKRCRFSEKTRFLVLSENFHVLSTQAYHQDRMAHYPLRKIKHIKDSDWKDLSDASMRREIAELAHWYFVHDYSNYFIIILTESKWHQAFLSYLNAKGCDYDVSTRPSSSDMFGASELCKLNMSEATTLFKNGEMLRIPMKIFSNSTYDFYPQHGSFIKNINPHMDVSFRQQNVHDTRETYFAHLDLTTSLQNLKERFPHLSFNPNEYEFHVKFSITSDAVITIDGVKFRKTTKDGEPFLVEVLDFMWKPGGLSDRRKVEFRKLISTVFK